MSTNKQHRRSLILKEGQGKYFKYAIGEILLIVTGILLALQISNWNEGRQNRKTMNTVYSIVKSDLLSDLETIDLVLDEMEPYTEVTAKILNREMTAEEYRTCSLCRTVLAGFPDFTLKTRGLALLEEHSTILHSDLDSLSIRIADFYSYHHTEISVATKEVTRDFSDNYLYYKNNKAWAPDFWEGKLNEDFIEYALTSDDYINRVSSFDLLYYGIYLSHLRMYKEEAHLLIEDIDAYLSAAGG